MTKKTNLTCALYLRVSSDRQRIENKYAIPTQAKNCMVFAERQGWQIVGNVLIDLETGLETTNSDNAVLAFVDDETANKGNDDRPMLQACLRYAKEVGFDFLVVDRMDRFSRGNGYQRRDTENSFLELGTTVVYADTNIIDNSPSSNFQKNVLSAAVEYENDRRAAVTRDTKRTKASKDKFVSGRTSYGYIINDACEHGLEIIDREIETVRMIYNLFTEQGFSLGQITKEINKLGIPAYKGGKWNRSAVWNILTNTTYAGWTYYGKFRSVKKRNKDGDKLIQVFIENDKDTWIEHKTPAVISLDQFNKAQQMLDHNRKVKRQESTRNYLLSGRIYCDVCGKVHSGQTKKRSNKEDGYYVHLVKRGGCRNLWLRADTLETAVWNKVKEILLNPDALIAGYEKDAAAYQNAIDSKKQKLAGWQEIASKYKQQRVNLNLMFSSPDNVMSKTEYLEAHEQIKSNLDVLEVDIAALSDEIQNTISPESVETFRQFTNAIQNVLHHKLDNNDKREIMRRLNIRVMVIDKDTIRLDGYFTTKPFGVTDVSKMFTLG